MTSNLKYGLATPNLGEIFGSVKELVELAEIAEKSGWDALFLWDLILSSRDPVIPVIDPWIALTAIAAKTKKLIIGTTITPLPRRRPWKVARETVSLDHFSNGRLILGVGLGYNPEVEFGAFGEETDIHIRAKKLDESLEIIQKLWSGKPFSFKGEHYEINNACFKPKPFQTPRIPIWGSGTWPYKNPFIRSAKLDGVLPIDKHEYYVKPSKMREIVSFISEHRDVDNNYDFVGYGKTSGEDIEKDKEIMREYASAGMNWWTEDINLETKEEVLKRIQAGPPRI